MAAVTCEWMFGDAATGMVGFNEFAHLNPMRWSGPVSFAKAVYDLQAVIEDGHGNRPVNLKGMPKTMGKEHAFKTCQEAIDFLQAENPVKKSAAEYSNQKGGAKNEHLAAAKEHLAVLEQDVQHQAEEVAEARQYAEAMGEALVKANEELKVKKEARDHIFRSPAGQTHNREAAEHKGGYLEGDHADHVKCDWMFGDAGMGKLGFALAHLDPMRWSHPCSGVKAMNQLFELKAHGTKRPILVRSPPGHGKEVKLETLDKAIHFIEDLYPEVKETEHAEKAVHIADEKVVAAQENLQETEKRKKEADELVEQCKLEIQSLS